MSDYQGDLRLQIELVPETAWWSNVRSNVSRAEWEKCKRYAKAKTGSKCYVCGGDGIEQGWRYPVEAHEIWAYDDDNQVQTLVDIVPLCPRCHQCKHLGRSRSVLGPTEWGQLIDHFQAVNNWPDWKVEKYVHLVFEIHRIRSQVKWQLDVSFLSTLGIEPRVLDR